MSASGLNIIHGAHFTATFWGRACGKSAYSNTFAYSFATIVAEAGCHGAFRDGSRKVQRNFAGIGRPSSGWGRRGGRLQGRPFHGRTLQGDLRSGFAVESILGAGGAAISLQPRLRDDGDCQVPWRRLCLSLRRGAAGPEWRWAPRAPSLALEQRLEQPNAREFRSFAAFQAQRSEQSHSALRPRRATRETRLRRPASEITHGRFRVEAGL